MMHARKTCNDAAAPDTDSHAPMSPSGTPFTHLKAWNAKHPRAAYNRTGTRLSDGRKCLLVGAHTLPSARGQGEPLTGVGESASYIPELGNVSPDQFGMSLQFVDGDRHHVDQWRRP